MIMRFSCGGSELLSHLCASFLLVNKVTPQLLDGDSGLAHASLCPQLDNFNQSEVTANCSTAAAFAPGKLFRWLTLPFCTITFAPVKFCPSCSPITASNGQGRSQMALGSCKMSGILNTFHTIAPHLNRLKSCPFTE